MNILILLILTECTTLTLTGPLNSRNLRTTARLPRSITPPTGSGRIPGANGTIYIDCKECFGWNNVKPGEPTKDPLCRYGCGSFKVYPTQSPQMLDIKKFGFAAIQLPTSKLIEPDPTETLVTKKKNTNFKLYCAITVAAITCFIIFMLLLYLKFRKNQNEIRKIQGLDNPVTIVETI